MKDTSNNIEHLYSQLQKSLHNTRGLFCSYYYNDIKKYTVQKDCTVRV